MAIAVRWSDDDQVGEELNLMQKPRRGRHISQFVDDGAAECAIMRTGRALVDVGAGRGNDQRETERGEQDDAPAPSTAPLRRFEQVNGSPSVHWSWD